MPYAATDPRMLEVHTSTHESAGRDELSILTVNLGSRTAKLSLLAVPADAQLGVPPVPLWAKESSLEGDQLESSISGLTYDAVGIRVVRSSVVDDVRARRFDRQVRQEIEAATEAAPLHTKVTLAAYDTLANIVGNRPIFAAFDTAFHSTIAPEASAYGLPRKYFDRGFRRIGYHGLSHEYATHRLAALLPEQAPKRRIITAHLGGGSSLAAIEGMHSVDTTMGYTTEDGLLMATRSGSLDPGVLLAIMRADGMTIDQAERIIASESGLLGLSGTADMEKIAASNEPNMAFAYAAFLQRARREFGAMLGVLGGAQAVAFLGGIGEHSARVRSDICETFRFAGIEIDQRENSAARTEDRCINDASAPVPIYIIHAREDWTIACAGAALLSTPR